MSFYVGQKVRINSPGNDCHGIETQIRSIDVAGYDPACGDFVGAELEYGWSPNDSYIYEYRELIPIRDDDTNTPCAFDIALWAPKVNA